MRLVALWPHLVTARVPESQIFASLCTIRAPATGVYDTSGRAPATGVYDTSGKFSAEQERHLCGFTGKRSWYMGAVAIGSRAYLAPYVADNVGVVDVASGTFSTISTLGAGVTSESKYVGAVAIGATVYFAPFDEDNVGVLDTVSSAFSTIRLDGVNRGGQNYADAVAVGTSVYMSPWDQDGVGVLDTVTSIFSTIDVGAAGSPSGVAGAAGVVNSKYWGAAALGTKVYFAPFYRDGILVLDTTTSVLSTISTSAEGRPHRGYASALVLGTSVYFSPRCESNIGVLETTSSTFSTINITTDWAAWSGLQRPGMGCEVQALDALLTSPEYYYSSSLNTRDWITSLDSHPGPPSTSMAAVGSKIYVVPLGQHEVGVIDTVGNVFSTINGTTTDEAYAGAVAVGSNVIFVPCIGDTVGVLHTDSATPPATGSKPDCSDAAASATSPPSLPYLAPSLPALSHLAPSQALRLTILQTALLSVGCFMCACTVFGGLSYHAYRRMATLRRSRDRTLSDLHLMTLRARPRSWGVLGTPSVSHPPGPPSTPAGGSAAGDAAVRRVVVDRETAVSLTAVSLTITDVERGAGQGEDEAEAEVLTLMDEVELEQLFVNEMPNLAQQDQQELSAPLPEAGVDEAAGLGGVHLGEQPQGKRQRQVASDEAPEGSASQSCSSPGPIVDALAVSIEDSWTACSTSASRVLAVAHAHRTSVSSAFGARASNGSVLGRPYSTSVESGSVNGPTGQKGDVHLFVLSPRERGVLAAQLALTPQSKKEASALGGGRKLHACTNCKLAKVTCVDGLRPCARCVRLGLPCGEAVKTIKHACTNCSRSKVKCNLDAENKPCGRCRRLGLVCVTVEHMPSPVGRSAQEEASQPHQWRDV